MSELPAVDALLPHRGPMLLIDAVVSWEPGKHTVARRLLRHDEVLIIGGRVPALATLELMAQTIGLHYGLEAHAKGEDPSRGFLIACKELRCHVGSFAPGEVLEMTATHALGDRHLGQFRCTTSREGQLVVEATVSVYAGLPNEQGATLSLLGGALISRGAWRRLADAGLARARSRSRPASS